MLIRKRAVYYQGQMSYARCKFLIRAAAGFACFIIGSFFLGDIQDSEELQF